MQITVKVNFSHHNKMSNVKTISADDKVKGLFVGSQSQSYTLHGITQCYLPPDKGERAPPQPQLSRPVLDLPTSGDGKPS